MISIKRTDSSDKDFFNLIKKLDEYLAICDGDEHEFYDQYNQLESIKHVIVLYFMEKPVACGAFKEFNSETVEIKRMYVNPEFRNNGYASNVLTELESWAKESGYLYSLLETGKRQIEAINFYKKFGYEIIENYPPYEDMENSICFQHTLFN